MVCVSLTEWVIVTCEAVEEEDGRRWCSGLARYCDWWDECECLVGEVV